MTTKTPTKTAGQARYAARQDEQAADQRLRKKAVGGLSGGRQLRYYRVRQDMTQGEFAELIGVSRMYYQQIESGERPVRDSQLVEQLWHWFHIDPKVWLDVPRPIPKRLSSPRVKR